ncbi:hypothetical protein FKW77_003437 [Venturia effusa]|uniref:Uncharacterized protein n=1 Tax=Venturia effusa TaxID=50376 RepID=A0A517L525_9PEZI|nr:hypothetical protein FKW77_003437 [Venturia effusa]
MKASRAAVLALLFVARAHAFPTGYQLWVPNRQPADPQSDNAPEPNRAVAHSTRKEDEPGQLSDRLERRQLIIPEIYCEIQPNRPECRELETIEAHQDGGLKAGPSKQPEKRFDFFAAFSEHA